MTEIAPGIRILTVTRAATGYGFSIHRVAGKSGHYIQNVDAGGAAEAAGLKANDYVIEINSINVEDKQHADVVTLIKSGGNQILFLVADNEDAARRRNVTTSVSTSASMTTSSTTVTTVSSKRLISIERSSGLSFGFTLRDDGNQSGHIVTQVASGSPSEMAGMAVGDRAVEINGTNVQNLTTNDVVKIIKSGGDKVTLLLVDSITQTTNGNATNGSAAKAEPSIFTFNGTRAITIRKGQLGFGFTVQGLLGRRGHTIQNIESGLPAEQAGLKNDDYLIEVNGLNVETFNHAEIVQVIKEAGDSLTFVVCDLGETPFIAQTSNVSADAALGVATSAAAIESVAPAAAAAPAPTSKQVEEEAAATTVAAAVVADVVAEKAEESEATPAQNGNDIDSSRREVTLRRGAKGFGFSLQCEKGRRGNFIQAVTPDGVADQAGLRNGDRVLEANGKNVENLSHPEVIQIVKAGGDTIMFVVTDKNLDDDTRVITNNFAPVAANELVFENKERLLSKISKSLPTFDGNWQFKVDNLNML
ncbi:uncharacterized protein TRIADDRAFT_52081 [Trichoplax adhaerens]|uniref:PDZ domain-containing protein n=1 Tax=Trichoplax adhaerens TaxID=10228 RepID=B3RLQ2_TRIAD|nr:hypothetical protein TRIADDRAFT_52081 [Trichoplax adhaerens]EDV29567.1 hypothetical protein TRIADDRAFT_52081 [Trichoplax adhaerens]|eukprot:XP_002108769.1 hypothetical protein TRIADDRAFT_52081 [Trichoplax adhaerens]